MLLTNFCKGIYPACPAFTNHENFMDGLFEAAGKKLYISVSYKRNLYGGSKSFVDKQKAELRGHDNQKSLEEFFYANIAADKVMSVLQAFGIPEKNEPNKKALSTALALQMKALIDSDEEAADNVIISSYQEAKVAPSNDGITLAGFKPLYPGDEIYVSSGKSYQIGSHDKVEHTWSLMNTGKVTWLGRKLVYRRGPKDRPEATPSEIPIPDVAPSKSLKLTTTFDGRGFDGVFRCIWEMQDSDGENCFPNRDSLFLVTIDAKFKRT